ncbi:flagellar hook assembly protein FlgD [Neptunicella marina]|uniref:Basal-body rod modification protein FlgD n=1 Tax=Neptunicella marina TaxID=2125989 RepID=A0A8J6M5W5_9ALTE|nr:flagellar hook assembly protein FlgD [Neptunicella marina]MBC3766791.1 flagellar hook assembly protein FlgD [Neptunicella marina]
MVDSVNRSGLSNDYYWQDNKIEDGQKDNGKLSQEDFFSLLTEQLSNQDPTKPVDNDQMIAQMTQFTMADSLNQLNEKFDTFAASMTSNQALQASSLIGQNVLIQGNETVMQEGEDVTGMIITDQASYSMKLTIQNSYGETVRVMPLGDHAAGNIEFTWDGKDQNGNQLPAGNYTIKANGTVGGESEELVTAMHRHVDSVSLASSSQGIILNLQGEQSVKLSDVLEIGS